MAPADAVAQVTPIEQPCSTLGRVSPVRMSPVPTLEDLRCSVKLGGGPLGASCWRDAKLAVI